MTRNSERCSTASETRIYRPETERWSHYSETILPKQFDAWVWFDETKVVAPLPGELRPGEHVETEQTYPFGL